MTFFQIYIAGVIFALVIERILFSSDDFYNYFMTQIDEVKNEAEDQSFQLIPNEQVVTAFCIMSAVTSLLGCIICIISYIVYLGEKNNKSNNIYNA
jgi:hypothetical protein